jgi:hypothetical protein
MSEHDDDNGVTTATGVANKLWQKDKIGQSNEILI